MAKEMKRCTKCGEVKDLECFNKHGRNRDGLSYDCRVCHNSRNRKHYQDNIEYHITRRRKFRQENPEVEAAYSSKYRRENRGKYNAINANYRAAKLKATPPWLTNKDHKDIRNIYAKAIRKSKRDGVKYHVDHIVPLQGNGVRGLHVPWNLQIITAEENLSKNNSHSDWG